ncbi:hypothetical protein PTE30175_02169 [Pandoraea terrae]|uniref:Uncharacterized protein n=1 Tax=Pandoraea terrae TaxID=1537710 RepID=A0A5E4UVK7_9BURK|nr:hypothetical protein PTE30175_02169 [Pandoraea terrae]
MPCENNQNSRISLERIENASAVIDPVFLNEPQFECESLSEALGARVALKVETVNPISFGGFVTPFSVRQLLQRQRSQVGVRKSQVELRTTLGKTPGLEIVKPRPYN